MKDDWRAALAYLERNVPERWAKTDRVRHEGTVEHDHQVTVMQIRVEQLQEALAAIPDFAGGTKPTIPIESHVVEDYDPIQEAESIIRSDWHGGAVGG